MRNAPRVVAAVVAVSASAVLVFAALGRLGGLAVGVAGIALVAAVQALRLTSGGPSLEHHAAEPPGEDGSPGWWPEFEHAFRRWQRADKRVSVRRRSGHCA
jgi:hypothetical protein